MAVCAASGGNALVTSCAWSLRCHAIAVRSAADPEVSRGQGDVPTLEHGDTRRAGGVDDLDGPLDERLQSLTCGRMPTCAS